MPLRQKIPGKRGIWGGIWLGGHRSDAVWMRLNKGVSHGDRGGVWGCCGVVLSYNFLPESKTYIPVRWAFPVREPRDIGIRISQWNKNCAFIWLECARIRFEDLPPKLPPKGLGTGQHDAALFCTHGTKPILSLGTQYHQTQQNSTLTHKFWISHNPEVAGSSPVSATNKRGCCTSSKK